MKRKPSVTPVGRRRPAQGAAGTFKNVLIGGEAGQGLQTVGHLLAKSLTRSGYSIHVTQTYESRVRGGHNTFSIRFGSQKVPAGQEKIDILVAMNEETIDLHRQALTEGGIILGNAEWKRGEKNWMGLPLKEFGQPAYWNTASAGVAAGLIGLEEAVVAGTTKDIFGEERSEPNQRVLEMSYRWLSEQNPEWSKTPPPSHPVKRLVMNGHEAVALGAISAGLKFCAFYPMSPSMSIAQTLIDWAGEMGLIVEQAEDEIAAVNMAIGASYAGVPSLIPTSGGGFALMVEAVSLAGVSETPLVIVVGQRPGPATGLATRTEQADLWFVLHAGHGEFPRAVFAPATIEDCFHLTRKAFELAEKYQGPVFVLTDHFLADSYRDMDPVDVSTLSSVKAGCAPSSLPIPYLRYRMTQDGVSPRLLPGLSEHWVVADSHEHTEDGHLTENLSIRPKMVNKRLKKEEGMRSEVIPPLFHGDAKPDLLLVSWGSTQGAAEEAAARWRGGKRKAATLHFSQVWPMIPNQFMKHLEQAKRVVGVEGNATGQLAQLIRRETGFVIQEKILRYDGLTITPEYILSHL